jgi:RimJ/RimL family protein N-acetyltransferase
MLSDHWPFFGLRIRTPRLELRYPNDDDCSRVADLTAEPVHDVNVMPFSIPWTRAEPPIRQQNALKFWWGLRAGLSAEDWTLPFVVLERGEPVGMQDVAARDFAVTRTVMTGSWLTQSRHGEGIGKEMRAAVLQLAFAGLGALEAYTSAFEDNPASLGVTRALGYLPNGTQIDLREGKPVRHLKFVLPRDEWERRRRDDISIEGLDPCLPLLGLDGSSPA